jgi:hypothetical protein
MNAPTLSISQSKSFSLTQITVPNPCRLANWDSMGLTPGNNTRRFCGTCEKQIHDLDSLTPDQIQTLVSTHVGDLCVRFTLPKQTPSSAPSPRRRLLDILSRSAAGILLASSIAFAGCASTPPPDSEPYKPSALSQYYNSRWPTKKEPIHEPPPTREKPQPPLEYRPQPGPFDSAEMVGLIQR